MGDFGRQEIKRTGKVSGRLIWVTGGRERRGWLRGVVAGWWREGALNGWANFFEKAGVCLDEGKVRASGWVERLILAG